MTYEDFKGLSRGIEYCLIKHLILLKIQSMMDIKGVIIQWFINFLTKKAFATRENKFAGSGIKNEKLSNKKLAEELRKPIIRNFF